MIRSKIYTLKLKNPYMMFVLDKLIHDAYGKKAATWYSAKRNYENCWFKTGHIKGSEASIGVVNSNGMLYVHYFTHKETQGLDTADNIVLVKTTTEFLRATQLLIEAIK